MSIEQNKLQLEKFAVDKVIAEWRKGKKDGKTKNIRLGQFFWDKFKLDRITDRNQLIARLFVKDSKGKKSYINRLLYELDDDQAIQGINQLFKLN